MSRRVAVRAIVMHDDKLLCVRLKPYNQFVKGYFWCLPGGGVDEGEGLVPALEREIVEELGIKPTVGELLYVQQFAFEEQDNQKQDNLEFFFHVTNTKDFLNIDLSKTTHGHAEIAELAFVDPATTHILPKFLTTEPLPQVVAAKGPAKVFSRLLTDDA